MNTLQVENMLRTDCNLSVIFDGVFASDMLPTNCDSKSAMVMNLDPSHQSGSHWVCIYVENGIGEYFDSYGLPPVNRNFINFLRRNSKEWKFNKNELQALGSDVCGHYCIWYLGERARGKSMAQIVDTFSTNNAKNDTLVRAWVQQRYGRIIDSIISKGEGICQQCQKRKS